jgi:hypothetical protein
MVGDALVVHVAAVDLGFLDAAMRRTWGCPLAAAVLDTARRLAAALEPPAPDPAPWAPPQLAAR